MYGLSGFAKKLNIQNCVNSSVSCGQYMYGLSWFIENTNSADMLNAQNCENLTGNYVH